MGFLDHSTNNIIVDAVLTDIGRQSLARNDGSFSIYQFALGDDEVDYDLIQHYGRTVGKEKIEKNTPVLEALTQGSLGLKYPLISISNEFLTHLPKLVISGDETVSLNQNITKSKTVSFTVSPQGDSTSIDFDLIDSEFLIEVNNIFLTIQNEAPDILFSDNIASYRFTAGTPTQNGSYTTEFTLQVKDFSETTFTTYSSSVGGTESIKTFVKITGINSGLTKTFQVNITKS